MCLKPAVLKNMYVPNVELHGKTLELVKREKYLGSFVTDSFYDDEYIKNEIGNTYARCNTVIRRFKHCSADVKVKLYNSYCCSMYCCALIMIYLLAHRNLLWDILRLPSSARPMCHSHTMTRTGREPATILTAA